MISAGHLKATTGLLFTWLAAAGAAEPPQVWTPVGPTGGFATVVRFAPGRADVAWAATLEAGIFRSSDGGVTWTHRSAPLAAAGAILDLEVAVDDAERIWASGLHGSMRSADGGVTWSAIGNLPTGAGLPYDLLTDPSAPHRLYALSAPSSGTAPQRLYRSSDDGDSWTQIRVGASSAVVTRDGSLWILQGRKVLRSRDAGAHWAVLGTGPTGFTNARLLAVDPAASRRLWASAGNRALWRSDDEGAHWRRVNTPIGYSGGVATKMLFRPDRPRDLIASFFPGLLQHSGDRGLTWAPIGGFGPRAQDFAINLTQPDQLLVATASHFADVPERRILPDGGIARSVDGGATFTETNRGLTAMPVAQLAVDPFEPTRMLVNAGFGPALLHTSDGGASWERIEPATIGARLLYDPRRSGRALVATTDGRLFRSADGGASFAELPPPAPLADCDCGVRLLADPTRDRLFASVGDGIVVSLDGGDSWQPWMARTFDQAFDRLVNIVSDPSDPPHALVLGVLAGESELGDLTVVYETHDDGLSFTRLDPALPGATRALVFDPHGVPGNLVGIFAAGNEPSGRLYRRLGDGTWDLHDANPVWQGLVAAGSELVATVRPTTARATLALRRSSDGGRSWVALGPELVGVGAGRLPVVVAHPGRPDGPHALVAAGNGLWQLEPVSPGTHNGSPLPRG